MMLRKSMHREAMETQFLPPPWNIILDIVIFLLSPPLLYVWLFFIALGILYCIYLRFKEYIDPVIIAILDCVFIVVQCVVKTCQAIWNCIKRTIYPIKEVIMGCSDRLDVHF